MPINMSSNFEWLLRNAQEERDTSGIVSVGGLLSELGFLPEPILKRTIIALHQSMFEAAYFKEIDSPRAKDKCLDAQIDAISAANHLALHYQVDFNKEYQIDKMVIMLANKARASRNLKTSARLSASGRRNWTRSGTCSNQGI